MVTVGLGCLLDLGLLDLSELGQLGNRRATLVHLLELVDFLINLAECTTLIKRQAHNTALLGNGLQNALTNPPYGIRNELKTTCLIKLLSCLNQSYITLVDKVGKCQTLMLILLCYRYNKSQIGCNKALLGLLALRTSTADGLSQLNLLVDCYKGLTTDFHKILIQCLTRSVGNAFLNL